MNFLRPREEQRILGIPKLPMDDLIVRIPLMTGLSPGEISQLTVDDVSYEYNLLFVWRSKVSNDHPAIIDQDTIWRIYEYVDKRKTGSLLQIEGENRMRVQYIRRHVKKYAAEAGITRWYRITPYTLRHTFCIKWVLGGGSLEGLRRQLGLKSLEKLKHYLDFAYDNVHLQYKRIFEGPYQRSISEPVMDHAMIPVRRR